MLEAMEAMPTITPLLVVRGAERACEFYVNALGATETLRYLNKLSGTISHADFAIGNSAFSVTEELRAFNSDAPPSLGGSPVVLQLRVDDAATSLERVCEAGATIVFPLQEFCGERMARVRDPFGHLWILVERIENLTVDEIQKRRDAALLNFAAATGSEVDGLSRPKTRPK